MDEKTANLGSFYRHFGLTSKPNRKGDELLASCPFCGKNGHFAIIKDTGQYNCVACNKHGNSWEFINDFHTECLKATSIGEYISLAHNRGLQVATLKTAKLAKSILVDEWLIPSFREDGRVANLYRAIPYEKLTPPTPPGKPPRPRLFGYEVRSSPSPCQQQLYGVDMLKQQKILIICEGHWDRLALWETFANLTPEQTGLMPQPDYSLNHCGICILGVPGANQFKSEWCKYLRDRHVILVFDNDKDKVICTTCRGRKEYKAHLKGQPCPLCRGTQTTGVVLNAGRDGITKVIKELNELGIVPLSLQRVAWKPSDPKDARDVLCL